MKRSLALAALVVATLAPSARGDDVAFISLDDMAKKRGAATAFVVVVAKEDDPLGPEVLKLLADPKLEKTVKTKDEVTVFAARIDPGSEDAAKRLDIPVEKASCLLAFDGYGVAVAKHAKAASLDALSSLIRKGQDSTKKKKEIEKKLDAVEAKGEDAFKKGDTKSACELFLQVDSMKDTVPCPAVTRAEAKIDELSSKGLNLLQQARDPINKKEFVKAHKLIQQAKDEFPTPVVLEEAKRVELDLAIAEKNASGK